MTSKQPSKNPRRFKGRTGLITIVSIIAVGLAGASAVSANIGILDSVSDSPVGNASVTGDLTTPSTQVVDVYLPGAAAAPTAAATVSSADPTVQEFAVDVAGIVAVAATDTGLRLDEVTPATGWSWTLAQSEATALMVTMTNGTRTFEFTATSTGDGTISANVNEPIVTPAASDGSRYEDDDEDENDEDHDDDDDEDHDDDEEDDDHEYEGGEDDD